MKIKVVYQHRLLGGQEEKKTRRWVVLYQENQMERLHYCNNNHNKITGVSTSCSSLLKNNSEFINSLAKVINGQFIRCNSGP